MAKIQTKKTVKTASKRPVSKSKPASAKAAPAKKTPLVAPAVKSAVKPHHGLGRGLGALIGETAPMVTPAVKSEPKAAEPQLVSKPAVVPVPVVATPVAEPANAVIKVRTELIERSPWQPRVTFDEEALKELSESIKSHGVIQPLVCRRLPSEKGVAYELIAGERRLRAAVDAGLTEVPVVLADVADRDAAEMAIIENIQREDLNIIEEAEGYKTLAEQFGLTQQDVADRVGKARPSVANALRLLELPDEVKLLLSSNLLSTGHAKVLLSLTDETEQTLLARRSVEEQLTVRALERLIARRKEEKSDVETRKMDMPESHIRYLLDKLHGKFGAPVRLQPSVTYANGKRSKGSIEIDFVDNDDLTRILDIFGINVD